MVRCASLRAGSNTRKPILKKFRSRLLLFAFSASTSKDVLVTFFPTFPPLPPPFLTISKVWSNTACTWCFSKETPRDSLKYRKPSSNYAFNYFNKYIHLFIIFSFAISFFIDFLPLITFCKLSFYGYSKYN